MALDLTGNDADEVDHGSLGSNAFSAYTVCQWINMDTQPSGYTPALWTKQSTAGTVQMVITSSGGNAEAYRNRATDSWAGVNSLLNTTGWQFITVTYDGTDGLRVFSGDLSTVPSESSYAYRQVGSGADTDVTGDPFVTGQDNSAANTSIDGQIAATWVYTTRFTLRQIILQWWHSAGIVDPNILLFSHYGLGGTNAVDLSGNGHDGTITGATLIEHPPINIRPFGNSFILPPSPAAAGEEHHRMLLHLMENLSARGGVLII